MNLCCLINPLLCKVCGKVESYCWDHAISQSINTKAAHAGDSNYIYGCTVCRIRRKADDKEYDRYNDR